MTLVSASSIKEYNENPYSGLPCYRERTGGVKQELKKIRNIHFAVPFETLSFALELPKWSTRECIFEEKFLSRRLLFFTQTQVYFQCSASVFYEDAVGRGNPLCARIYPASDIWNLGSPFASQISNNDFGTLRLRRQEYSDLEDAISDYFNSVQPYTKRDMTYNSDILNAFKCIEGVMKQTMKTRFWYGLPERFWDSALLWTLVGSHKRREACIKGFNETHFPSWTWAGCESEAELGSYFFTSGLRREVHWYIENRQGEMVRMATEGTSTELEYAESEGKYAGPQGQLPDYLLAAEKSRKKN